MLRNLSNIKASCNRNRRKRKNTSKFVIKEKIKLKLFSDFQSIMTEYDQIDYKMIESLFKLLGPIWLESELNKPINLLLNGEVEKLENKIINLMDFKLSHECTRKIEVFFYVFFFIVVNFFVIFVLFVSFCS